MIYKKTISSESWRATPSTYIYKIFGGRWKPYKHLVGPLDYVGQKVLEGGARIIINMPAQYGKSYTFSVGFTLWYLEHFPEHQIVHTSYESTLSRRFSAQARDEAINNDLINLTISRDNRSSSDWRTAIPNEKGILIDSGGFRSTGMGGAISGIGSNLTIVDDPLKGMQEALSDTYSENNKLFHEGTLEKRCRKGGSIIVICTRWSEKDYCEYLIKENSDDWTVIKIKEKAEENDILGRKVGECLCPDLHSQARVDKRDDGSIVWVSMSQQEPTSLDGNIFKRDKFQRWLRLPEFDFTFISWDMNFGNQTDMSATDSVVGQYWGYKGADKYLIDRVNLVIDFAQTLHIVKDFNMKHTKASMNLIENKANGPAVISALTRIMSGLVPWKPQGKMVQAIATQPHVQSSNVYIPDSIESEYITGSGRKTTGCDWVNEFLDQVCGFPNKKHDDDVDAFTQAILKIEELKEFGQIMIG
jgi:predicted phage terminase large subunit-like protein